MTTGATDEFSRPWRAILAYALLACVLTLLVAAPIATMWRGEPPRITSLSTVDLFLGQILLAAFLAAWFVLQDRATWRDFFSVPAGAWASRLARGASIGLAGWAVTLAAMAILGTLGRAADVTPSAEFANLVAWLATRPLVLRLALIACAMTIEEAFFRAFLQPRFGILTATLCFAASHMSYGSPIMGGGVFVIGLVLGATFARHHDLATCAVAHGVFDGIQLLVVLPLVASRL